MDERTKKLAKNIINYSISLQKDENLLIEATDCDLKIVKALIEETYNVGANPFVNLYSAEISRALLLGENEDMLKLKAEIDLEFMKKMDAYISIKGAANTFENSDVPSNQTATHMKFTEEVRKQRVNNTKWATNSSFPTAIKSPIKFFNFLKFLPFPKNFCLIASFWEIKSKYLPYFSLKSFLNLPFFPNLILKLTNLGSMLSGLL